MKTQQYLKEYRLPHGHKLLEQIGLEGSGPRTPDCPKTVDHIGVCDHCHETVVKKACNRFTEDLNESNPLEALLTFVN